jgi:DNA replication protein DnaC
MTPNRPAIVESFDLDAALKRLHLANTRRVWRDAVSRAEQEDWAYADLLVHLMSEEIAQRAQTRLGRLAARARFPFLKTIDEFDFTHQSALRLSVLGSALSADFITEGRAIIFSGKPGRGKTHLAVAVAYRALQNGFEALFTTAAALIDDLSSAFRQGRLSEALARYVHPHVLVVDEVGYLTYSTDAANMLFHVVNERHRRKRSMIFTTNKPLDAWGAVLHDEDLAAAILDRILERGRIIKLDGPSMRTRHLGLDAPTANASPSTQPIRISGIHRSEFPEPTTWMWTASPFGLPPAIVSIVIPTPVSCFMVAPCGWCPRRRVRESRAEITGSAPQFSNPATTQAPALPVGTRARATRARGRALRAPRKKRPQSRSACGRGRTKRRSSAARTGARPPRRRRP